MKTLLLGSDGQVGWQLQRSLAPHGEVVACSRRDCDLTDLDALRLVLRRERPQVIVNAAAYTAVDRAESEGELAWQLNAVVPEVLAGEAAACGALLVHYSTDYVFAGDKIGAYVEDDPVAPLNLYGRSKLAGEAAIRAQRCKSLIFRTSWVFGARGNNFVKTILRLAAERENLRVVNDQIGAPTPAALIATVTGVVLAMLRHGQGMATAEQRLYHLAARRPVSWCEFAQAIVAEALQTPGFALTLAPEGVHPISSAEYPCAAQRPLNSRLDCSRLEQDFGLQMPDWQPYLRRMLQLLALKQRNGY
ncbi:dTDP-4-dehydrorhamnose reductase [Dechloromonas sp. ZY10]|uniref:dTDP-4-dehydrorhamnose reductase n=1 Tax=Dechloromonas aquae TaxID=2664436 RepID=UPI003528737F